MGYDPILKRDFKSPKADRIDRIASGKVTHGEMREIGIDLLAAFKKEFSLSSADDTRIDHLTIKPIPAGQCVYDHSTCVQILCVGVKERCHSLCSCLCPRCFGRPTESRMAIATKSPGSASHDGSYTFAKKSDAKKNKNDKKKKKRTLSKIPVHSLTVERSFDSSIKQLPMINVSSSAQMENSLNLKDINSNSFDHHINELTQSQTERELSTSRNKMNAQTLFADVYKDHKDESPITGNTQNLVDSYSEMYKQLKKNQKEDVNEYGYSSKRKINLLSDADIRVRNASEVSGKAPKKFSASLNTTKPPTSFSSSQQEIILQ